MTLSFTTNNSLKQYTTILQRHKDEYGNNICEEIGNELKQVVDREVLLEQIPHPNLGMEVVYPEKNLIDGTITNITLKEINLKDTIKDITQIKIDYNTGKITTHYLLEGKFLNISYWGTGRTLIHSSRVYTQLDEWGDVCQTLDELIDIIYKLGNTDYIVKILQDIENAKVSVAHGVSYPEVGLRLNSIEQGAQDYLDDHLQLNKSIGDVAVKVDAIKSTVEDVNYRMGVLENNYLNPNFITTQDIDNILKGVK